MARDFEQLVERYQRLVLTLIRRYYGGALRDNEEDLAQDIWAKLWENFKKNEQNIVNFKSYLYRTVQTTLWDAIRALDSRQDPLEEDEHASEAPDEGDLNRQLVLNNLMDRLKPDEAQMLKAHLKGFNAAEIAVMLGQSEGRVRNLLTRIKKKMKAMGGE